MNIEFASAVERAQLAPNTFAIPAGDDLVDINPGDFVKVCVTGFNGERHGERFWVEVTAVDGATVKGTVANDLLMVPLPCGTPIEFGKGNVFGLHRPEAAT